MRLPSFNLSNPFRRRPREEPPAGIELRSVEPAREPALPTAGSEVPLAQPVPTRTAPIPIGGTRPEEFALPEPPYLRARTPSEGLQGTPPPNYESPRPESMGRIFRAAPVEGSPAPSYSIQPREGREEQMETNFGGVLGMEPETASLASNMSAADSMRGQYPRSELEARRSPISEQFSDPDLPGAGGA